MGNAARRLDTWLVAIGATSLIAWSVLAFDGHDLVMPAICSTATPWPAPLSVSFDQALMLNSPAKLVSDWSLMIVAMMLPLVIAPLQHVRDRSFARRRTRATLIFVAGYLAIWTVAGFGLLATALAARWAVPEPLLCLGVAAVISIGWQVSPTRQWCLNRCHRRPHLAAFGAAADRDAFSFGLTNGASCVGACSALMLLTLVVEQGHLLGMAAVALFILAERLENPAPLAWRWRGPGKALRIVMAQARMRLAPRSCVGEASLWQA
jgi:predicted metal-binding membrane protein